MSVIKTDLGDGFRNKISLKTTALRIFFDLTVLKARKCLKIVPQFLFTGVKHCMALRHTLLNLSAGTDSLRIRICWRRKEMGPPGAITSVSCYSCY